MVDRGRQPGFALEPLSERGVGGALCGDQFDCHRAIQTQIGATVNDPHAPAPDERFHAVASEIATYGEI